MKIYKIISDVLCTIFLSAALVIVNFFMEPHERGFFCDDQTINYPLKSETISTSKVIILGFIFLVLIIVTEIIIGRKSTQKKLRILNIEVPNFVSFCYHKAGSYVIGALTTLLIGDIMKFSLGRLRPNFIDACKPSINCSLLNNKYLTPEEFNCSGTDFDVKEARLSFPSNHASCITYFGVFLICYLQLRMTSLRIFKYLLQVSLVVMISFISITRISDYMHHWSDVVVGILIGFVNAFITVFIVADLFKERKRKIYTEDKVIDDYNNNFNALKIDEMII